MGLKNKSAIIRIPQIRIYVKEKCSLFQSPKQLSKTKTFPSKAENHVMCPVLWQVPSIPS